MSEENNNNSNKNGNKSNGNAPKFNFYWVYAIIAVVLIGLNFLQLGSRTSPMSWVALQKAVSEGDVSKIVVYDGKKADIFLKKEALTKGQYTEVSKTNFNRANPGPHYTYNIGSVEKFEQSLAESQVAIAEANRIFPDYRPAQRDWFALILSWLLPIILLVAIWMFIMRRMGGGSGGPGAQIFNIGKSKATLFDDKKVTTTFADIAGLDEAKEEVMEVVDFLKSPKKYTALGGKIPKGVLLVGNPGTGKTLLAKAVAGEAGVPFFSISGSDFVEMFVGVGASRVRDLFRQAREKAPCIIFIDEIDAIGRARGKSTFNGNDERENTLNQLLVEMDGFSTDKGVIIIAATNRPDILDNALLRPGRFDRQIAIDLPDLIGREQIFKVHIKPIRPSPNVDPAKLAILTAGFAGADIANVCNEAALIAARRDKKHVEMDDFEAALDRVIGGLEKKNKLISPEEKRVIAYHEAGHAICGWYLEFASPLLKVTIVPRGIGTLGYAQYLPKEQYIVTTEQLLDRMCMTLGGRAAESVIFNRISTGAQSDLDQVTKMSYSMISIYGMNERVGNVSFYDMQNQNTFSKPFSESTSTMIDEEARKLILTQFERAKALLREKRHELELLANELLNKEVLLKEDVERLIGSRPFDEEPQLAQGEKAKADNTAVGLNDEVPANEDSTKTT